MIIKKSLMLFGMLVMLTVPRLAQADVVLKVVGFNPSSRKTQEVPVKIYLPKEIQQEHVIDAGDLTLAYDVEKKMFYVQATYELGPEEMVEREVKLKDVWRITEKELTEVRAEAAELLQALQGTEYEERARFVLQSIYRKLETIGERQNQPSASPEEHILSYRNHLALLETARKDLVLLRSYVAKGKILPSVTIWKVFFIVIGFLSLLALVLFIVWNRQSRSMPGPLGDREELKGPERRGGAAVPGSSAAEIEDIIKKDKK